MNLTAEKVNSTFLNCLYKDNEDNKNYVIGEGVMMTVGFNPERLKKKEPTIVKMLDDLPNSFKKSSGGGMSFLGMCQDKEDNQWTGLHQTMDQLVCLGNAIGKISFVMPKEMWPMLPGGVPYITVF